MQRQQSLVAQVLEDIEFSTLDDGAVLRIHVSVRLHAQRWWSGTTCSVCTKDGQFPRSSKIQAPFGQQGRQRGSIGMESQLIYFFQCQTSCMITTYLARSEVQIMNKINPADLAISNLLIFHRSTPLVDSHNNQRHTKTANH